MAFQTIPGGLWIPRMPMASTVGLGNMLIDASSEKAAGLIIASKTGTISKGGFLTGTVTTGATVDLRLEAKDGATGDPSGTLLGANSNVSQVIGDGDDNTWFLPTLTTGVAVTKGDEFFAVIANAGSGDMNIRTLAYSGGGGMAYPGYTDLFTASWAKAEQNPVFAFEYDDGSYDVAPLVFPCSALSDDSFSSSSTPDERALKFKLSIPFRVTGGWVNMDLDEAVDIVLYDSDGSSVLQTVSLDKDLRRITSNRRLMFTFPGTEELAKDTFYRLAVKPTTTTNVTLTSITVDAVAIMDSWEGGQDFHYSERTDAGSWTDITTQRPLIGLYCDAFDDGAGGVIIPRGANTLLRM